MIPSVANGSKERRITSSVLAALMSVEDFGKGPRKGGVPFCAFSRKWLTDTIFGVTYPSARAPEVNEAQ